MYYKHYLIKSPKDLKNKIRLFCLGSLLFTKVIFAQNASDKTASRDIESKGISVSPAHFHLSIEPGNQETHKIAVTNQTDKNSYSK